MLFIKRFRNRCQIAEALKNVPVDEQAEMNEIRCPDCHKRLFDLDQSRDSRFSLLIVCKRELRSLRLSSTVRLRQRRRRQLRRFGLRRRERSAGSEIPTKGNRNPRRPTFSRHSLGSCSSGNAPAIPIGTTGICVQQQVTSWRVDSVHPRLFNGLADWRLGGR
jgi:hypothetical protein